MSRTVSDYLQAKRNQEIQTSMQERHAQLWMFAFGKLSPLTFLSRFTNIIKLR